MSYIAKAHMQPGPTGDPGKAPAWYLSTASAAVSRPSFLAPSLTSMTAPAAGPVPRNTSSRLITILTGRPVLRDIAKAAADLGWDRADLRDVDAEQLGAVGPHHEVALARAPDRGLSVSGDRDDAGVGLDVSLMHRRVGIAPLDRDIGLAEPGVDVALGEPDLLRDVGGMGRFRVETLGEEIVVQQRRVGLHRLFDVDDVRQHVVVDLDQVAGLLGDRRRSSGDGSHRVAVVENLVARHAVARQITKVHRPLADEGFLRRDRREVFPGHHRLDARQRSRLLGVDREDARVGMWAPLDFAP